MSRYYKIRYVVEGAAPIPLDMLRYDASYPKDEGDAHKAGRLPGEDDGTVQVTLEHRGPRASWVPKAERWKSFLWRVVSIEPAEEVRT